MKSFRLGAWGFGVPKPYTAFLSGTSSGSVGSLRGSLKGSLNESSFN